MTTKAFLTYTSFVIASVIVLLAYITATTYIQLGVAVLLYPLLALFAYKIFPFNTQKSPSQEKMVHPRVQGLYSKAATLKPAQNVETANEESPVVVSDIDKRSFLKLVGVTGISFFLISIFSRRVETLLLNGQKFLQQPSLRANRPVDTRTTASSSPTEGYSISEIDEGVVSFYGFVNKSGGWFIMKGDSNTGSFRYTKGNSNFPINWNNREDLQYDYFHEVFISG